MKFADDFLARVRERLEAGEREYAGRSHARPTDDLLVEIQQELEDVCGWSAILWARLQRLRELNDPLPSEPDLEAAELEWAAADAGQFEDNGQPRGGDTCSG